MKKLTLKALKSALDANYFLRGYFKINKETHLSGTEHEYNAFKIYYDNMRLDVDVLASCLVGAGSGFITSVVMREYTNLLSQLEYALNDK